MAKDTLTAIAEAEDEFRQSVNQPGYTEARQRFLDDIGRVADLLPTSYPAFTEEHIEMLFTLGYLD